MNIQTGPPSLASSCLAVHNFCPHKTYCVYMLIICYAYIGLAFGFSQQNCLLIVQAVVDQKYLAVATVLVSVNMYT